MTKVSFSDFFRLLNEWKEIVALANSDLQERDDASVKIDYIIDELKKPTAKRDSEMVLTYLNDLKKVKGIERYVGQSLHTIMLICRS